MSTIGDYIVTLETIECIDDNQKWLYSITLITPTPEGHNAISDFSIELCPDLNVIRASKNGIETAVINDSAPLIDVEISDNGQPCLTTINIKRQIKWDELGDDQVAPATNGLYDFVLDECFEEGLIKAAIKAGPTPCSYGDIRGPICEGRGLKLYEVIDNE